MNAATRHMPRPYQIDGRNQIYDAWRTGYRNVLYVLPTGGGKTFTFASIVHDHRGASCAIAHRQELVGQISMALARDGVVHRIIGPEKVIRGIVQMHVEEFGKSFYDPRALHAVAGVDTLVSWSKTHARQYAGLMRWAAQVTLVVQDECFPAGTLIDGKPIENIRVGDTVTAFNEHTGEFEPRKVVRLFKNAAPKNMMRIDIAGHHALHSTSGHPFWTRRGWVEAINLTTDDEVLIYDNSQMQLVRDGNRENNRVSAIPTPENRLNILSEELRIQTSGLKKSGTRKGRISANKMLRVRKTSGPFRSPQVSVCKNRKGILREGLFNGISSSNFIGNGITHQQKVCLGTDENKQPYETRGLTNKNDRVFTPYKTLSEGTRGQQCSNYTRTRFINNVFGYGVFSTTHHKNRLYNGERDLSALLQSGHWACRIKNSDRSGRQQSFIKSTEGTGYQEGFSTRWARVDSVTIYERRNTTEPDSCCPDGYVYNFEVEGLHTYVADSVVVHNCHHLLRDNKWGKALELFPNAWLLGVTATPERADGKGLGRGIETPKGWTNDGLFDHMVVGPSMRDLIDGVADNYGGIKPFLTKYKVFCPPSNLDLTSVTTGADGDYIRAQLALKTKESTVLGDVVTHYLRHARGKLGVTFVPDVETAGEMSRRFNEAGVPAEVVTAKTPDRVRREILRRFARRELLQLVNVDLFGEGFDLPAIEVVSMARATKSYALYVQQFGRALRLMEGKEYAIILDHVGNVFEHKGPPDKRNPASWTLARRDKRNKADDTVPQRNCTGGVHYLTGEEMEGCFQPYEAYFAECPHCGCKKVPGTQARTAIEFVDGDLFELDPETMACKIAEVSKVDRHVDDVIMGMAGMSQIVVNSVAKSHREKQSAQNVLRQWIGWWAAWQTQTFHRSEAECYKRFYWKFNMDVMAAQALGRNEAEELTRLIAADVAELEAEYRRLAA